MTSFARNFRLAALGLVLVIALSPAVFASPIGPAAISAALAQSSSNQTSEPAAPETQVKPYTLPPGKAAQARAYAHSRHELYFLDLLFSLAALLLILQLAIGPRLRNFAERRSSNRFVQAILFAVPLLILFWLLSLPAGAAGHWIERHYGQSVQGWISWFVDALKGGVIALIVAIILIWLFYGLLRRSPRRWWFYAWLGSLPILVFLIFVEPLVLEPLFFHFTPLAASDPQLAEQLERVVQHAGQQIPESRMFLMNASSKLNALNAYVSGIGSSERVVVWDTTIKQMTTPEILFVFGHEMGHYVLHHIRDGIIFSAGILIVFFFCEFQAAHWVVARFGSVWKIRSVDDWASLPVLVLIALIFSIVITPIDNAFSRHLEHQADQYGLEVVHGIVPDLPRVAAHSFQILGEIDLSEPAPSEAVKIWFYDHPTLDERIRFAQAYDPWRKGQSPELVK